MSDSTRLRELLLLPRHLREQPEVVCAIREAITQDEEALRYYVRWMRFESNLHWVLQEEGCSSSLVVSELRRQVWRIRLVCASVASVVVLMVVAGLRYYSLYQERAAAALVQSAILDAGPGMVWASVAGQPDKQLRNGDRLTALAGSFLLRMKSGAVVACEAPLDIENSDSWEVFLHHGGICVQVPPRAHGFRSRTRVGTVVDLGTVFGMRVDSGGETEVQVLEGNVEINPIGAGPQHLRAGVVQRITGKGVLAPPVPADPRAFQRQLAALIGIPSISSAITPLLPPPLSVEIAARPSASTGCVFREQSQLVTEEPLELYGARPGKFTQDKLPKRVVLPAGTAVATYFIHAENSVDIPVDGELTFAGEILGLALSTEQLNNTDAIYGHPDVLYPNDVRRKTIVKEPDDEIEISQDRRTIRFRISCSVGGFDQFRVFVREPQPAE